MNKYRMVIIVLVYLNSDDLVEFIESVRKHLQGYKIIVVNSYYDDASKEKIEKIALENDCDFLNVENKGYSYGNNQGIKYATEHYIYDFAIISNPDTVIESFDLKVLDDYSDSIIAPLITAKNEKKQNPLCARNNKFGEMCKYYGYLKNCKLLLFAGIAINKLNRELFLSFFMREKKLEKQIFAAHGSFVIFPAEIIAKMGIVYDEKMFLFSEEMVVAYKMKSLGEKSIITKRIQIKHKEDGSQKLSNICYDGVESRSMIYSYEKYARQKSDSNNSL